MKGYFLGGSRSILLSYGDRCEIFLGITGFLRFAPGDAPDSGGALEGHRRHGRKAVKDRMPFELEFRLKKAFFRMTGYFLGGGPSILVRYGGMGEKTAQPWDLSKSPKGGGTALLF